MSQRTIYHTITQFGDYFLRFSEEKGRTNGMGYTASPSSIRRHHERALPVGVPGKPTGEARPSDDHKPPMRRSGICPMIKFSERAEDLAEHFKLNKSASGTLKGKLILGAEIVTKGGVDILFRQLFVVDPEEKLLKSFSCYLSTTIEPVAGVIFISTQKFAFCSERRLTFTSPSGGIARSYYRVVIPVKEVRSVNSCENSEKPSEKCIEIQTLDKGEFWFMGFANLHKVLKYMKEPVETG